MINSVATLQKYSHRSLSDWLRNIRVLEQTSLIRRDDSFDLRQSSRQLRNESSVRTSWDLYHNNARLANRVSEVDQWLVTLIACRERIDKEYKSLKEEKANTERELETVTNFISIVSEGINIRGSREGNEMTFDDVDKELQKELCVLEDSKRMLTDMCHNAWEKLNQLQSIQLKLSANISNKEETLEIDKNQLALDKNCANVTSKIDALQFPKKCVAYDTWLEYSQYIKLLADNELADSIKYRENLLVFCDRSRNNIKAQRDCVDYVLRKRIFETQKAKNEAQWQQQLIRQEMKKLHKEINNLDFEYKSTIESIKLPETRLENRFFRPGVENCRDEPQCGLQNEIVQLRQTTNDLLKQLNYAKATLNVLEEQQVRINQDSQNKCHSLMTDLRCLDSRVRLHTEKTLSETDINMQLTNLADEIP